MKKNIRNKILIMIQIILLILLVGFLLLNMWKKSNHKTEDISFIKISAKESASKYDNINYGTPKLLTKSIIKEPGSYTVTGSQECITIDTNGNVQLNLENANITCTTGPAIYIISSNVVNINITGKNNIEAETTMDLEGAIYSKEDLILTGKGELTITSNQDGIVSKDLLVIKNGTYHIKSEADGIKGKDNVWIVEGTYSLETNGDGIKSTNTENISKGNVIIDNGNFWIKSQSDAIEAANDLIINDGIFDITTFGNANLLSAKGLKSNHHLQIHNGNYTIKANNDGIHSDGSILISKGSLSIKSSDDAIHADGLLQIENGTMSMDAKEGLEATTIKIKDGLISIKASDNGISVGNKKPDYRIIMMIMGGEITIDMGPGDSRALDSSHDILIQGGTIYLNADTAFQYYGEAEYTGGTILVNGKKITKIPEKEVVVRQQLPEGQTPPTPPTPPNQGR